MAKPDSPLTASQHRSGGQADRQKADAKWLRSLGKKAREIELDRRKAATAAEYEAREKQYRKVKALHARIEERRRARERGGAISE
jgi:hypothetical protein